MHPPPQPYFFGSFRYPWVWWMGKRMLTINILIPGVVFYDLFQKKIFLNFLKIRGVGGTKLAISRVLHIQIHQTW